MKDVVVSWVCLLCFANVFVVGHTSHRWPVKNKVLHIGGIFPINGTEGWQGGMVCCCFFGVCSWFRFF